MAFEIGCAFRVGNGAVRSNMIIIRHAVLSHILRQTGRVILSKAAKEEPEPGRIDFPSHVGFRQIAANAPEPDMRLAAVGQNHRPRVVVSSDPVQRRADQRQIFLITVRHMPIEQGENILRIARLENRFLEPAVVDAVDSAAHRIADQPLVEGGRLEVAVTVAVRHERLLWSGNSIRTPCQGKGPVREYRPFSTACIARKTGFHRIGL